MDWDAGPADQSIGRLRFRYASGETDGPQHTVELVQGADAADEAASGVPLTELEAIVDVVERHGSAKPRQEYRRKGNMHRDWNLARIAATERRRLTLNIGGSPLAVEVAHWWEPERLALARLTPPSGSIIAASVGMTLMELLRALKSLVELREARQQ